MLRALSNARRSGRSAAHDESGAVAIEFAIISPLLLVVLVCGAEITQAVMASRKVASATRTIADLTAQMRGATAVTPEMIDEIYAAGRLVVAPYDPATLKVAVSRVDVKAVQPLSTLGALGALGAKDHTARTVWTATRNGATPRPCTVLTPAANTAEPAPDTFPEGMHFPGRFIVADVTYVFRAPLTANFDPGALGFAGWRSTANGVEMRRTVYMQMRADGNPTMTDAGACPAS